MSNVFSPQGPNAALIPPLGIDVNRYGSGVETFVRDASAPGQHDGTVLDAAFFNRIITNLHHIIDESRINAEPGDSTALFRAIKKITIPPERKYRPGLELRDNFIGLTMGLNILDAIDAVDTRADKFLAYDDSAKTVKETTAYDLVRASIRAGGILNVFEDDTSGTVTFTVDSSNFVTLDRRVTGVKGIGGGGDLINNPEFYLDLGTLPAHEGGIDLYRDRMAMHDWSSGETRSVSVGEVMGAALRNFEILIGVDAGSLSLGEFGGGALPDNLTIRQALQALASFTEDGFASIGDQVDTAVDAAIVDAIADVGGIIDGINDTIVGINQTITELTEFNDDILGDVTGINQSIADLTDLSNNLLGDITGINQSIADLTDLSNNLLGDVTGINETIADLTEFSDNILGDVTGIADTVAELTDLNESLVVDMTGLAADLEAQANDLAAQTTVIATTTAAVETLTTRVTAAEGVNTSQATALTVLTAVVDGKASAAAVSSLDARVTAAEGVNTSQATAITNLNTTVASKASASALTALTTRVTDAEGVNTSQATQITNLNTAVAGKASASALSALDTRVTAAEGVITSTATAITNLNTTVAGKASASALSALDARVTTAEGSIEAVSSSVTALAAGGLAFKVRWDFLSSTEGWTGSPTLVGQSIRAPNGNDPRHMSPTGLAIDSSAYNRVQIRIRKVGSPSWDGTLYWAAPGEGFTGERNYKASEPLYDADGWGVITMSPAWSGVIDAIRIDLTHLQSVENYFLLDWVGIGRQDATAVASLIAKTVEIDGAITNQAAQITTLQSDIAGKASASAFSALETRVTSAEGVNTSQGNAITSLTNTVNGKASTSSLNALDTRVSETEESIETQATALTNLTTTVNGKASTSAVSALDTRLSSAEGTISGHTTQITNLNTTVNGKASASALSALETRVTSAEGVNTSQGTAITNLTNTVNGKASTSALNALDTRVTATEEDIDTQATAITNLTTTVNGKASTSAVSALDTRMTAAEGTISGHTTQITNLNTTVNGKASSSALSALETRVTSAEGVNTSQGTAITNLTNTVNGKASTSALNALDTRVTATEEDIDTQATAITNLTTTVDGKASTSALNALTTRMTAAEGTISGHTTSITNLNTAVAGKASASALSALDTRVSAAEGVNTSQGSAITSLTNTVNGKADASAVDALTTRVTESEGHIDAISASVTALEAGGLAFHVRWDFLTSTQGWTGFPGWPVLVGQSIRLPNGNDPRHESPAGLAIDAATQDRVQVCVRKVGTPSWDGRLYWAAAGESFSGVRSFAAAEPHYDSDGWGIITMSPAWSGIVDKIRIDLTHIQSDEHYFLIDWVGIGKRGATAVASLTARTEEIEGEVTNQAAQISTLQSDIAGKASASALSALTTRVTDAEGVNSSQGTAITNLTNTVNGKASTSALNALTTRVSDAEGEIDSQATAITNLNATVAGKADASALSALTTRVTATEGGLDAVSASVTALEAGGLAFKVRWDFLSSTESWGGNGSPTWVNGYLRAANHATDPYVTSPLISVNGSEFDRVQLRIQKVGNPAWAGTLFWSDAGGGFGIGGRAQVFSQPAWDSDGWAVVTIPLTSPVWATTVTRIRLDLVNNQDASNYILIDWVGIGRRDATAVASLTAKTVEIDGAITNQSSAITDINTALAGKASASALSVLTTQVNDIDGNIDSLATALTEISAGSTAGDVATAQVKMSAVSAPSGWTSRYAIQVRGGTGDTFKSAGMYMDVISGGASRVVFETDKFVVQNGGTSTVPFSVTGNVVYLGGGVMVQGGNLVAGTVSARSIQVGAISDNLVLDSEYEGADALDAWGGPTGVGTGGANGTISIDAGQSPLSGKNALKFDRGPLPANSATSMNRYWDKYIPVMEGDRYFAEFRIKGSGASAQGAYLRLRYYDANKAIIAGGNGTAYYDFVGNGPITTDWVRHYNVRQIPAGVRYVRVMIYHHSTSTIQNMWVSNVLVKKQVTGDVIVNGSIKADKLDVDELSAITGNLGSITVGSINLAPDAVIPSKFYNSDSTNMLRDPDMVDASLYSAYDGTGTSSPLPITRSVNPSSSGLGFSKYKLSATAASAGATTVFRTGPDITVEPGRSYYISMHVSATHVLSLAELYVIYYYIDASGNAVEETISGQASVASSAVAPGAVNKLLGSITIPAGVTRMQVCVKAVSTGTPTASISSPVVKQQTDTFLLANNAVTTAKLANGAVHDRAHNYTQAATGTFGTSTQVVQTVSSDHGAGAKSVEVHGMFRNNSGSSKLFTVSIDRGDGTTVASHTATVPDNTFFNIFGVDGSPTGSSTTYNLRVQSSTGSNDVNQRRLMAIALKV